MDLFREFAPITTILSITGGVANRVGAPRTLGPRRSPDMPSLSTCCLMALPDVLESHAGRRHEPHGHQRRAGRRRSRRFESGIANCVGSGSTEMPQAASFSI